MACDLVWVGVSEWWCRMDASGHAAWVQAIGSILAILVALFIPYWQKRGEEENKRSNDRRMVMGAAANLDIALGYESSVIDFTPAGDGEVVHDFTLEQAREFMKVRPQTREALNSALQKSHYFDNELCEQIVRLSIESASYERIIDDAARRTPKDNADAFFKRMKPTQDKVSARLSRVRELLQPYLPKH